MENDESFFRNPLRSQRRDLYEILEVSESATQDEIRKKYKILAFKFHPDKHNNEDEYKEKFQQINFAFSVLSDKKKRHFYDTYGNFGLDLFTQVGEDRADMLLKVDNPCIKVLMIFACLLTGCCYCYCCCCLCCFNFCCGLCAPKQTSSNESEECEFLISDKHDNQPDSFPITKQPIESKNYSDNI